MSDRLQKWTAFLVALSSIIGAAVSLRESSRQAAADFGIVEILAEQLAQAQKGCP